MRFFSGRVTNSAQRSDQLATLSQAFTALDEDSGKPTESFGFELLFSVDSDISRGAFFIFSSDCGRFRLASLTFSY
jgi:hypothetical protein